MAIAFDTASSAIASSAASTASWNHTIGAGANTVLLVCAGFKTTASSVVTVNTITYGGSSLTFLDKVVAQGGVRTKIEESIWYLINPPTGTTLVQVTYSNSSLSHAHGVFSASYTGINSVGLDNTGTAISSTPNISITLTTGGSWGFGAARNFGAVLLSTVSGETIRKASTAGASYASIVDIAPGTSGINTLNWTGGLSTLYIAIGTDLIPAAAAPPGDGGGIDTSRSRTMLGVAR